MISKTRFLILMFTLVLFSANGQVNEQNIRLRVLKKEVIDSTFVFGKWTEKGQTETRLTYLGQVKTRNGQTFKIVTSIWFWGLSHRATSRILIFTSKNEYVGNYSVTVTTDLPTKMQTGKLIFKNTHQDCDRKLTTIIDLRNGLPKEFFRKCKGKYGDTYSFDNER